MPEVEKFGVAIAGLGTVGSGVAQILSESRSGEQGLFLKSILEREPEKGPASQWYQKIPEAFVKNQETILEDPEIRVIVETIGGIGFAREFTLEALKRGKHVVTANKDLIASHGSELCEMAQSQDRHYLFEAAVAGAIPVLRLLREYFQTQDILELEGILNGTTNYILSEMESRRLGFEETLKKAQELGFAEQDPTNDIKGFDARYKLVILIYL
ncbi:MAG: homoserine dehydrogenase, partial [SAR324 cluster bacterium]|nr:homoserine dehydrogenase [SAR324 cluster bacterium]